MCVFTSERVVQQQSQKTASLPGQEVPFEVGALIIPITIVIIILIATIEVTLFHDFIHLG